MTKANFKKDIFVQAHSARVQSITVQSHGSRSGHTESRQEAEKDEHSCPPHFLLMVPSQAPAWRMTPPMIKVTLSAQFLYYKNSSWTWPGAGLYVILNPIEGRY